MAALCTVNAIACVPVVKPGPTRQELGWTAYLGSARHDAAAHESLNPDPRPLWHTSIGRAARGSPALGESILAVGTVDRTVVLLDRASGEVLWRQRVDGTIRAGPLLDEDRLYVATESQPDGRVYAIRLRDGKPIWRTRVGSVVAPLAYDGEALYAGTEGGAVVRVEPEGGRVAWRRALSGAIRAGPVATATPGAVLGTPATDGRRLYLGTTDGRVLAVDLAELTVRWERPAGDAVYGAPALVHDTLYVLTRDGHLWLIPVDEPSAATSHALGIVALAGPTPIVPGVLVGSVSGEILLVDRGSGSILWRAQVAGPIEEPPLVQGRQLVVVAGRGDIQAYR